MQSQLLRCVHTFWQENRRDLRYALMVVTALVLAIGAFFAIGLTITCTSMSEKTGLIGWNCQGAPTLKEFLQSFLAGSLIVVIIALASGCCVALIWKIKKRWIDAAAFTLVPTHSNTINNNQATATVIPDTAPLPNSPLDNEPLIDVISNRSTDSHETLPSIPLANTHTAVTKTDEIA